MPFDLANFGDPNLDVDYVTYLVDEKSNDTASRHGQLWDYFRNPMTPAVGLAAGALNANSRPYFQAQEVGLPARITGIERTNCLGEQLVDLRRKEVVIENDIAWRVNTMVDFLFGKPITIRSAASDPSLAETIEKVVEAMLNANGGTSLLQEMALLGAVYGFVDIALRTPAGPAEKHLPSTPHLEQLSTSGSRPQQTAGRPVTPEKGALGASKAAPIEDGQPDPKVDRSKTHKQRAVTMAGKLHLETIEAPRVLPILDEDNYRRTRYWLQRFHKHPARLTDQKRSWLNLGRPRRRGAGSARVEVVQIIGPNWWQRYEDRILVTEGPNSLGKLPIVHIQNVATPGSYEGLSDVEPLISLQDELNTRLSDRANRVTYQSFKMYLGKGIDDFLERPVGPGQMWATHNMDASIEEFGADSGSPSEDAHIEHIRQAMDKISAVTPLAAGLIRGNVGHLTSATALKVLMSGLLSRTAKKRLTYGAGLQRVVDLALEWLNLTGVLHTKTEDRQIEIHWQDPLPIDESEKLRNAQIKSQLGVPKERILAELGYESRIATDADE